MSVTSLQLINFFLQLALLPGPDTAFMRFPEAVTPVRTETDKDMEKNAWTFLSKIIFLENIDKRQRKS